MKKIILLFFPALLLMIACNKEKPSTNTYLYQETLRVVNNKPLLAEGEKAEDMVEKAPDTIRAKSDEAAYLQAYGRFCSSVLFHEMYNDASKTYTSFPKRFTLVNSKGEDVIATLDLPDRKEREDKIWESHISLETTLHSNDSAKLEKVKNAVQVRF